MSKRTGTSGLKMSLRHKMFILNTFSILMVTLGTAVLSYNISAKIINNYYENMTMDCAENFATMVDPKYLMDLRRTLESDEYRVIRDHAEETDNAKEVEDYLRDHGLWDGFINTRNQIDHYIESMDAIKYTYILARNETGGTTDMYIMDDSTNPTYVSGSSIESEPEFYGIGADQRIEPTISNGDWGWLCSAYVPVFLDDGTLVGQIGCDIGMDDVMHERQSYFAYILLGSVALTLLMVIISGALLDKFLVKRVSTLTGELKKFNPAPVENYDDAGVIHAGEKENDEIDELYQGVHEMQVRIIDNINDMDSMNLELARAARMKSDFLANMSHEIRTPMNAVIGMAEVASREELSDTARDALTQIQKSGRNLLNIINDILDYSKIESGKMDIIPEEYEPISELNDVANILSTRIGPKNLELFMDIDPDIPHILYGDAMRIRQVLINLANNAIKFTRKGSVSLKLTCSYIGEDKVSLTYHIIDTGIGIRQEDMDKLFTSFSQVDSRRNRSVEGTGLGLAISQRLIKAMGGELGVESTYGEGSDFWFTIEQKVIDKTRDLIIENIDQKRAVCIDDDPVRIEVFRNETQKLGIDNIILAGIDDYTPSGKKDYIFLEYRQYTDNVRRFFEEHSDINGIVLVDYNSDFTPGSGNVHTLRRPASTLYVIRALNNTVDEPVRSYNLAEDFAINFTAPDARILIVDDNAINITVVEGLLSPMRINIDSALSGQEAIDKVTANDYDIVFMDHMMPGLDGIDTTKIIRELLPDKQNTVIIALSANVMESAREAFAAAGMNDFVAKPIEIRKITSKIRKWLPAEKIHKGSAEVVGETTPDNLPILGFEGLDSDSAINTIGSVALYDKIVKEYYRSGKEKYEGIKKAFETEDIEDYTIRVHALKSSSRQIGAAGLGDMAEELEKAGNERDIDTIHAKTLPMLETYDKLLNDLADYYPETPDVGDKPLIDDGMLKEQFDTLHNACENLDMDAMEAVGNKLRNYSYPDEIKDMVDKLLHAIDNIDTEECESLIEEINNR